MSGNPENIFIPHDQMKSEFIRILKKYGFTAAKAEQCADIFTTNSLEGVISHGVNRFPRFVRNVQDGFINPASEPSLIKKTGAIEQWDGNLGAGPLNAIFATDRSISVADENGIGLVALSNTNHWMRAGAYGWHAAEKGYVFIGWTNTIANMPAWGARDVRLGNNPFVIAVPDSKGSIVLDFAMTQFSYGKMEAFENEGKQLPFPGGFDTNGELTASPGEILETWRTLPIGYWKGAGLSLLLDILAAILSGGRATHEITGSKTEYGVSQIFISICLKHLSNFPSIGETIQNIKDDIHSSIPESEGKKIRYPGENVKSIREESLKNGIPVNPKIWEEIMML
ncbi:MAG: 3-dehydro-L-gulonate 2-dehydrogenase [Bacteroidales bacterium]|jgi:3-dehydro-L-gulonate 2-dehydrogenase|nr:3-dehydro-L-gulonate 2-dehydrogenase [Bacteroidales bacterium]